MLAPGTLAFAAIELDPRGDLWHVSWVVVAPTVPVTVVETSEYQAAGVDDLKAALLTDGPYLVTGLAVDPWFGAGLADELSQYIPDVTFFRPARAGSRQSESVSERNGRRALAAAERHLYAAAGRRF